MAGPSRDDIDTLAPSFASARATANPRPRLAPATIATFPFNPSCMNPSYHGNLTGSKPPLGKVAEIFFRIGNTTFGGGYVTIGMLGRELVEHRRWLTADKFDLAFALSRVTPGTNLIAFCAAAGALLRGWSGALAAVFASTLPSAAIAVFLMYSLEELETNRIAMAAVGGTVAAVAGMMWSTIWTIMKPHVGGRLRTLQAVLIAGGAFVASWYFGISPLTIILMGTLVGFLWPDPGANRT